MQGRLSSVFYLSSVSWGGRATASSSRAHFLLSYRKFLLLLLLSFRCWQKLKRKRAIFICPLLLHLCEMASGFNSFLSSFSYWRCVCFAFCISRPLEIKQQHSPLTSFFRTPLKRQQKTLLRLLGFLLSVSIEFNEQKSGSWSHFSSIISFFHGLW